MKARWYLIALLLAFPFAFAFFLSEARLGEKRAAAPAVSAAPLQRPSSTPSARDISPIGPMSPIGLISENPAHQPANSPHANTTPTTTPLAESAPAPTANRPVHLEGTFTREDGSLIYESDIRLRLANDVVLSSPTGVMVSDEQQKIFAGDMTMETAANTIVAHEGILNTETGQLTATIASISFTTEKNQLIRMTGENVTLELPSNASTQTQKELIAESLSLETSPAPAR